MYDFKKMNIEEIIKVLNTAYQNVKKEAGIREIRQIIKKKDDSNSDRKVNKQFTLYSKQ